MNSIFIFIFIMLKLLFHFCYCIPKRRTHKHDPDYAVVVVIKILPDIQCISNILVVHCLFSLICVSFFFGRKKVYRRTKIRYLPMTHIRCVKNVNSNNQENQHNNLLRWMQINLIIIMFIG